MSVSQFQGVINVNMYDTHLAWDFSTYGAQYALFGFDDLSNNPLIVGAQAAWATQQTPDPFTMSAETPAVGGFSSVTLDPTNHQPGPSLIHSINDTLQNVESAQVQITVGGYVTHRWQGYPRPPGNYSSNWNYEQFFFNGPFCGSGVFTYGPFPGLFGTIKCVTSFVVRNQAPGDFLPFWWFSGGNSGNFQFGTPDRLLAVGAIANFLQGVSPLNNAVFGNVDFDNCMFTAANSHHGNVRWLYNSIDWLKQRADTITLDNAGLETAFSTQGGGLTPWFNGWNISLQTDGAGPTGNKYEHVVFTPDMTQYWCLKFIPEDAVAGVQLSRTSNIPNVKIDSEGIIWFNSGNPTDVRSLIYSYSTGFQFPSFYAGNLQPITLDCFVASLPDNIYPSG